MSGLATFQSLSRKGVLFHVEGEQLRWTAPEGTVQPTDMTSLRAAKWLALFLVRLGDIKDPKERIAKQEQFDERAGICEFEGNMNRTEAEERAYREVFS